eukprot:jgi/Bigna1/69482/fgenesh1_pg.9_\
MDRCSSVRRASQLASAARPWRGLSTSSWATTPEITRISPKMAAKLTTVEFNECLRNTGPILLESSPNLLSLRDKWGEPKEFIERLSSYHQPMQKPFNKQKFAGVNVAPLDPRRVAASGGSFRGDSQMSLRELLHKQQQPRNGTLGRSGLLFSTVRDELYQSITAVTPGCSWVPAALKCINLRPVVSIAAENGDGLDFHRHDESWLGLIYGRKEWFIAPPDESTPPPVPRSLQQRSSVVQIEINEADDHKNHNFTGNGRTLRVIQEEGNILYLPKGWWHATRTLLGDNSEISVGIGGIGDSPGMHPYVADGHLEACYHLIEEQAKEEDRIRLLTLVNSRGSSAVVADNKRKMSLMHTAAESDDAQDADEVHGQVKERVATYARVFASNTFTSLGRERKEWMLDDYQAAYRGEEKGADLSRKDTRGTTPLHLMASEGHMRCVEFLVDAGADICAKDKQGMTPLSVFPPTCACNTVKHHFNK